jgi:ankyrin repeat protein
MAMNESSNYCWKPDVNASDEHVQSVLYWAVHNDDLCIVRLLLASGANPTLPDNYGNKFLSPRAIPRP